MQPGISRWPFRKLKSLNAAFATTKGSCTDSNVPESPEPPSTPELVAPEPVAAPEVATKACDSESAAKANGDASSGPNRIRKAESAIERNLSEDSELWPTFRISGVRMTTLVIESWSFLWSVEKLKKYILEPAQGCTLTISEDGSKAYMDFGTPLGAVQARKLCEKAIKQLQDQLFTTSTVISKVENWLPQLQESMFKRDDSPANSSPRASDRFILDVMNREVASLSSSDTSEEEYSDHEEDAASAVSAEECEAPVAIQEEEEDEGNPESLKTLSSELKLGKSYPLSTLQHTDLSEAAILPPSPSFQNHALVGTKKDEVLKPNETSQHTRCSSEEPWRDVNEWASFSATAWNHSLNTKDLPTSLSHTPTDEQSPWVGVMREWPSNSGGSHGLNASPALGSDGVSPLVSPALNAQACAPDMSEMSMDNMSISHVSGMSVSSYDKQLNAAASVASRDSLNFSEFSDLFECVFESQQPAEKEMDAASKLESYLDGEILLARSSHALTHAPMHARTHSLTTRITPTTHT